MSGSRTGKAAGARGGEITQLPRAVFGRVLRFWRTISSFWIARLLVFAGAPALVLLAMNVNWTDNIANIGCIATVEKYDVGGMFSPKQEAGRCALAGKGLPALEAAWPAAVRAQVQETEPVQVAISQGRFQWMTFHLVGMILFPAVALVAIVLIWRNLAWRGAILVSVTGVGGGLWWANDSVWSDTVRMDTASLLLPTKLHALVHYDAAFQESAWAGTKMDYGLGLAVTVLLVVAAASVVAEKPKSGPKGDAERRRKRGDLKLAIAAGATLLTFLAFYVGEWLAWPAQFAANDPTTRGPDEFKAVASGLRLYFGTGYTLALLAFAIPAVLALPHQVSADGGKAVEGTPKKPKTGQAQEPEEGLGGRLYGFLFSKDEMAMVVSVLTPFLTTLAGAALQL